VRLAQHCATSGGWSVSAEQGGGADQTYDGWRVVSQLNFGNGVETGHSLKPPEWVRQERNSRSRGLSTEKLTPDTSGEAKASSSCAFAEPCDGKRNRLAPVRIRQSFFMKWIRILEVQIPRF
jgi:hypothetical protein